MLCISLSSRFLLFSAPQPLGLLVRHRSLFAAAHKICHFYHRQQLNRPCFLCTSSSPSTSTSTTIVADLGTGTNNNDTKLCSLKAIPKDALGISILCPEANRSTQRIVLISKICSIGSSALGLLMILLITSSLWESISERPTVAVFVGVSNVFLVLFACTPLLLHFLTKRFVQNVFFNRRDQLFTTVHYNFFLQKRALRFAADQLVDAGDVPKDRRFWLPLATCLVHSHPMLLPLDAHCYSDQTAFKLLTTNIKPVEDDQNGKETTAEQGRDDDDR